MHVKTGNSAIRLFAGALAVAIWVIPGHVLAQAETPSSSTGMPLPSEIGMPAAAGGENLSIKPPEAADPMATTAPEAIDPLAWSSDKPAETPAAPPVAADVAPAPSPLAMPAPPTEMPPAMPPAAAEAAPAAPETSPAPDPLAQAPEPPVSTPEALPPVPEETAAPAPSALEERLSTLEKQVEAMQKNIIPRADFDSLKGAVDALARSSASAPAAKATPRASSRKPAAAKKRKAPVRSSAVWILKSAKPGQAWISESGSTELHTVTVGEIFKDLGNITSIERNAAGKWVVSGTRGKVIQGR